MDRDLSLMATYSWHTCRIITILRDPMVLDTKYYPPQEKVIRAISAMESLLPARIVRSRRPSLIKTRGDERIQHDMLDGYRMLWAKMDSDCGDKHSGSVLSNH
jgi:hypothetical protein